MMIAFTLIAVALAGPAPGIIALDHVEHFRLSEPGLFAWNAEMAPLSEGTLFVVEVDPERALTRQTGAAVLYAGNTPAARLNPGHLDGHIVAYVPGTQSLASTPIYWGPSTLPERVHPSTADTAMQTEAAPGTFSGNDVSKVKHPLVELKDQKALQIRAAKLIEQYAPGDIDFAKGYRAGQAQ